MADRPILFSAPMVKALLAGTKTQTRRILKLQPEIVDEKTCRINGHLGPTDYLMREIAPKFWTKIKVGDRLWVREAWRTLTTLNSVRPAFLKTDTRGTDIAYEAGGGFSLKRGFSHHYYWEFCEVASQFGKLRPSMFMPRWASRLTLSVTDVRVQRLLDISDDDAWAEGVCQFVEDSDPVNWDGLSSQDRRKLVCMTYGEPVQAYRHLWETINGPLAWDEDPWVAAYTFTVHHANIDALPVPNGEGR